MEYQVTITEVLSRTERVEASSAVMAEKMVRLRYAKEDIVLDYSDFKSVDFHTADFSSSPKTVHSPSSMETAPDS